MAPGEKALILTGGQGTHYGYRPPTHHLQDKLGDWCRNRYWDHEKGGRVKAQRWPGFRDDTIGLSPAQPG